MATLVRVYDRHRLIAEDTFNTQIKLESQQSIELVEDQIAWLLNLQVPFTVMSVNVERASASLFCDHALSAALTLKRSWQKLTLLFEEGADNDLESIDAGVIRLGQPVLRWSLVEMASEAFRSGAYSILKPHIVTAAENLRTRAVGWCNLIRWRTGERPIVIGWRHSMPKEQKFEDVDDAVAPFLFSYIQECARSNKVDMLDEWIAVMEEAKILAQVTEQIGSGADISHGAKVKIDPEALAKIRRRWPEQQS